MEKIEMTLSNNQEIFLAEALAGKNIFLTGKAGTGKSHITKVLIKELERRGKNVGALAPTGIAANNIGGATLHSTFSLPPFGVRKNIFKYLIWAQERKINMEIAGFVKVVGEEISVSSSFTKRELVVTTEEQYPQHILINFTQGKCNNMLDQVKPGDKVTVSINIRGREWINPQGEAKYFNDIQGWQLRIDTTPQDATPQQQAPAQMFAPATDFKEEEHDDLPF